MAKIEDLSYRVLSPAGFGMSAKSPKEQQPTCVHPVTMPFAIGTIVANKYRIERVLGQGGMGTVYQAEHLLLERSVALKQLRGDLTDHPAAAERLLREGRALARLRGRHIARVLDVEAPADGPCFLVLEYLEGEDLATVLKRESRLPVQVAANYVIEACEALAEAHAQGIIHRDIKPSNLFLTKLEDGSQGIKVIDFGIARHVDQSTALTQSRSILGSPCYMAPEQMRANGQVDKRADLWALGVVFYELLTGQLPHQGDSVLELCASILESPPKSPRSLRAEIPERIDVAIRRCLERDPVQRYDSVGELAKAIAPFSGVNTERMAWILPEGSQASSSSVDGRAASPGATSSTTARHTQAETVPPTDPATPTPRRRWLVAALLLVALALGFALVRPKLAANSPPLPTHGSRVAAVVPSLQSGVLAAPSNTTAPAPSVELAPDVKSTRRAPDPATPSRKRSASAATTRSASSANSLETDPVLKYGHF